MTLQCAFMKNPCVPPLHGLSHLFTVMRLLGPVKAAGGLHDSHLTDEKSEPTDPDPLVCPWPLSPSCAPSPTLRVHLGLVVSYLGLRAWAQTWVGTWISSIGTWMWVEYGRGPESKMNCEGCETELLPLDFMFLLLGWRWLQSIK